MATCWPTYIACGASPWPRQACSTSAAVASAAIAASVRWRRCQAIAAAVASIGATTMTAFHGEGGAFVISHCEPST